MYFLNVKKADYRSKGNGNKQNNLAKPVSPLNKKTKQNTFPNSTANTAVCKYFRKGPEPFPKERGPI